MAKSNQFFKTRGGLALTGLVSLAIAWLLFLRATDTGSLQQYGLLIVALIVSLNRFKQALKYQ